MLRREPLKDTEPEFVNPVRNAKSAFHELKGVMSLLGGDVDTYFSLKMALLKKEISHLASIHFKGAILTLVGAILAILGLIFLNVALGFAIARLFPFSLAINFALGFLCVALVYTIGGGLLAYFAVRRMTAAGIVPDETVKDLRRDQQWLKGEAA